MPRNKTIKSEQNEIISRIKSVRSLVLLDIIKKEIDRVIDENKNLTLEDKIEILDHRLRTQSYTFKILPNLPTNIIIDPSHIMHSSMGGHINTPIIWYDNDIFILNAKQLRYLMGPKMFSNDDKKKLVEMGLLIPESKNRYTRRYYKPLRKIEYAPYYDFYTGKIETPKEKSIIMKSRVYMFNRKKSAGYFPELLNKLEYMEGANLYNEY